MEKVMIGIAGLTLGILGVAFTLVGLISYAAIPGLGMLLGGIFVLIGVVFLLMTMLLTRSAKRFEKKMMDIVIQGRKVEANIIEIRQNTMISVNRRHPYYLVCEAEGQLFESEYFYQDVHRFDERETIDVYIDDQSHDYVVDLDS
ncbi:MAG: hypothetical protein IJ356_02815 [Erysipelotrichaceae bacterium]|nr:hypothetical protein [Erysipelotrichaceae bacterium]